MVEIVKMVIVAEEHVIEITDACRADGGLRQFSKGGGPGFVFAAGRIECWVREKADRTKFEEGGRAADVGERQ